MVCLAVTVAGIARRTIRPSCLCAPLEALMIILACAPWQDVARQCCLIAAPDQKKSSPFVPTHRIASLRLAPQLSRSSGLCVGCQHPYQ